MNEQVPLFLMIGIAAVTSGASQKFDDESARLAFAFATE
jgi:hypothetical protein